VFTFNKAMDPSTLPVITLGSGVTLTPEWSANYTKLTLKPGSYLDNANILRLPYSTFDTHLADTVTLTGLAAADGSPLYPDSFDIYTERGLTLEGYEISAAPVGARSIVLSPAQTIKLIFNKELSTEPGDVSITWNPGGVSQNAVYRILPGERKAVYVYPDGMPTGANLGFTVTAADDRSDSVSAGGLIGSLTFTLEAPLAVTHVNGDPAAASASIAQNQNIILDFNREISNNLTATLYFEYGSTPDYVTPVPSQISSGPRRVTISPDNLLAPGNANISYRLRILDKSSGVTVIDTAIPITVTAADAELSEKQPVTGGVLSQTAAGAVLKSATNISLDFIPPSVPFSQTYTIKSDFYDLDAWTGSATTTSVAKGDTALITTGSVPIPGVANHLAGENIRYKVEGVNGSGFVTVSNIITLTFTP
jgi:hypothetical protein